MITTNHPFHPKLVYVDETPTTGFKDERTKQHAGEAGPVQASAG
ncbi:hypothetical protein RBWH47_04131 [Rhodopirellula baltica WH47]|uniref:Uncharacterized protein n=1 Tax=Rhodopirellula baltica WH47 TaxID=991778 RepID=F2ATE7_RHOBT|nr:hypothetical protein RBWH47_04131 [Rhodopirellula baltica WH47]